MRVAFGARRKTGRLDLEALELAVRSAMHQAGAAVLTKLLQFPTPTADQHNIACACGHQARYRELRSKPVLTAVGKSEVRAPTTCAPIAIRANSPLMSNWISRTRNSLLGCVACRR